MTSVGKSLRHTVLGTVISVGIVMADAAVAQDVSLNSERLSSMEEPTAIQVGEMTLVLNGLLDSSLIHDAEQDHNTTGGGLTANFQISASSQLMNRWRVRFSYFGQYTADDLDPELDDEYSDNAALSVGGAWGNLLVGNVSGVVRDEIRRLRGAGNAVLGLDDSLGELDDTSAGYVGRFGPWVVSSVVDGDGRFDAGLMSQRPAGNKDYRLTLRANTGDYVAADGSRRFDTKAAVLSVSSSTAAQRTMQAWALSASRLAVFTPTAGMCQQEFERKPAYGPCPLKDTSAASKSTMRFRGAGYPIRYRAGAVREPGR